MTHPLRKCPSNSTGVNEGLVDIGYDKHFRMNHGANECANRDHHINGIESFWSYARGRLAKFNGLLRPIKFNKIDTINTV